MATLNQTLINMIRSMQTARGKTLEDVQRINEAKYYTADFKRTEAARFVDDLRATKETKKAEAAEAVAAKIADLDNEEKRLAEVRAMDSDYLNRLNLKMENMERLLHKHVASDGSIVMDDLTGTMLNQMRTYFSEFQNDPLAIAIIRERLGSHGAAVAPSDNTGKRQAHLQAVQSVFNGIMNTSAGVSGVYGVSEVQNVDSISKGEEDAFMGYCMAQNEDFSLDDKELIESCGLKDPNLKLSYDGILWRIQIAEKNRKRV